MSASNLSTEAQILKSFYSNAAPFYKTVFATNKRPKIINEHTDNCGVLCPEDSGTISTRALPFSPESDKLKSLSLQPAAALNNQKHLSPKKRRKKPKVEMKGYGAKKSGKRRKRKNAVSKRKNKKPSKNKSRSRKTKKTSKKKTRHRRLSTIFD